MVSALLHQICENDTAGPDVLEKTDEKLDDEIIFMVRTVRQRGYKRSQPRPSPATVDTSHSFRECSGARSAAPADEPTIFEIYPGNLSCGCWQSAANLLLDSRDAKYQPSQNECLVSAPDNPLESRPPGKSSPDLSTPIGSSNVPPQQAPPNVAPGDQATRFPFSLTWNTPTFPEKFVFRSWKANTSIFRKSEAALRVANIGKALRGLLKTRAQAEARARKVKQKKQEEANKRQEALRDVSI